MGWASLPPPACALPPLLPLVLLLLVLAVPPWSAVAMRADRLAQLRRETVDMFYHGYSNYMHHAFPEDELRPISCAPLTRDRNDPTRIGLNDALGNYSLTLIDSLSTLAILAGGPRDGSYTGPQALADFQDGIAQFVRHYGDGRSGTPGGTGIRAAGFDLDSKVQVFETVIRGVGGLLSAHLFAIGELPIPGYVPRPTGGSTRGDDPLELPPIPWPGGFKYDGQLLRLAFDLAQRLLPAFYTPTGIPYPRVNLRSGIPFYLNSPLHQASGDEAAREPVGGRREITETCSAGAGSLTLEFTVLSRLTGDARFEQAAKRAFWEVWRRRSDIGLIGNGIDAEHGMWIGPHAGIGAGMDSFFEYALKSHILLSGHETPAPNASTTRRPSPSSPPGDNNHWLDPGSLHGPLPPEMHSSDAFLEAWHEAHASVKRHLYTDRSHYPYYANSHRATGQPYTMWIDSLGAFYPGLLALAGEVDEAIEANLVYTALWTRYSALPERWSIRENNVEAGIAWWPGRPEFIESTYHIFRATRDPWYLHVGEMVLWDIGQRCHAPCGWAGLQDVRTGEKQDRMESFFLGETTKYMYLLFDPHHPLNSLDAAYVFTTEGHPLILPRQEQPRPVATRRRRRRPPTPPPHQGGRHVSVYKQHDDGGEGGGGGSGGGSGGGGSGEGFTNTCPAPPRPPADSLAGSATAARPQLFGASRFTDLFNTPNVHGPIEAFEADGGEPGAPPVTRYRATSNHSLFPWTLPPSMLPARGTCAAPPRRIVSAIEFPVRDAAAAAAALAAGLRGTASGALVWHPRAGPVVQALEGLRIQLEREELAGGGGVAWRITHIGATQLGRHETVFFHAEHVRHFRDEAFTCLRRRDAIEVELLVDVRSKEDNTTTTTTIASPADTALVSDPLLSCPSHPSLPKDEDGQDGDEAIASMPSESLLKHLLRAVSSVLDPSQTDLPATDKPPHRGPGSGSGSGSGASILSFYAHAPVGPGAAPLPRPGDTPVDGSPSFDARRPAATFPWSTVFLGGRACAATLADAAPRDHQLLVLRRGGCSFAQKLANIPAFTPAPDALQLVVVVDDDAAPGDDEQDAVSSRLDPTALDRPLLAAEQLTPEGSKRLHGVPLVLVRGREGDYERFGRALAAGMRNKYRLESQGFPIVNAVVM